MTLQNAKCFTTRQNSHTMKHCFMHEKLQTLHKMEGGWGGGSICHLSLPHKPSGFGFENQNPPKKAGMGTQVCNPSNGEVGRGSMHWFGGSLVIVWLT